MEEIQVQFDWTGKEFDKLIFIFMNSNFKYIDLTVVPEDVNENGNVNKLLKLSPYVASGLGITIALVVEDQPSIIEGTDMLVYMANI